MKKEGGGFVLQCGKLQDIPLKKSQRVTATHKVKNHRAGCSSAGHCLRVTASHKLNGNQKHHVIAKTTNRPWNVSAAVETFKAREGTLRAPRYWSTARSLHRCPY